MASKYTDSGQWSSLWLLGVVLMLMCVKTDGVALCAKVEISLPAGNSLIQIPKEALTTVCQKPVRQLKRLPSKV